VRLTGPSLIVYLHDGDGPSGRAGFIVAKTVGGATVRNLVKRRLRAATAELIEGVTGDLVVRALPSSAVTTYRELHSELFELIERAQVRRTSA